jgi:hypothetical protein
VSDNHTISCPSSHLKTSSEANPPEDVVPALRQYLSIRPSAVSVAPSVTARELRLLDLMERESSEAEVEAALEALTVEGEVLA